MGKEKRLAKNSRTLRTPQGWAPLPGCAGRTVLLDQQLDHAVEIGIAGAKTPRKPVPAAPGDRLAVREHVELTSRARRTDGVNVQAFLDEGHETRDLGAVVLSRRAMNDFDLHSVLRFIPRIPFINGQDSTARVSTS